MDADDGEALHAVTIDSRWTCDDALDEDDVKACWMSRAVSWCEEEEDAAIRFDDEEEVIA